MSFHTACCLLAVNVCLLGSGANIRPCNVMTIWVMYVLAAAIVSGILVAAGWRSKQVFGMASGHNALGSPNDALWREPDIDLSAPECQADVGAVLRLSLKRLAPIMAKRAVRAEVAVPFGLLVRMRAAAAADLLEELVATAIHAAPASHLLLTASRQGDRIYIGITDDMPGADLAVRVGSVRGLMERVALRGGAVDVDVRPAEGTTMTLRLAAVTDLSREHAMSPAVTDQAMPPAVTDRAMPDASKGQALPEPAKGPRLPSLPAMERDFQLR